MSFLFEGDYATEKDGTTSTLDELYDAFTYSGGVYSATLWQEGDDEYPPLMESEIFVSSSPSCQRVALYTPPEYVNASALLGD